MKTFKFFQKKPYRSQFPSGLGNDIDELIDNPPQYIIDCGEIGAFNEGIRSAIYSNGINPYPDELRSGIWNRGFWDATNIIHRR